MLLAQYAGIKTAEELTGQRAEEPAVFVALHNIVDKLKTVYVQYTKTFSAGGRFLKCAQKLKLRVRGDSMRLRLVLQTRTQASRQIRNV